MLAGVAAVDAAQEGIRIPPARGRGRAGDRPRGRIAGHPVSGSVVLDPGRTRALVVPPELVSSRLRMRRSEVWVEVWLPEGGLEPVSPPLTRAVSFAVSVPRSILRPSPLLASVLAVVPRVDTVPVSEEIRRLEALSAPAASPPLRRIMRPLSRASTETLA